jgi:NADPH-dependent ferric siderophore reductase
MADASSALRKLQSGQALTAAEKSLLGISGDTIPATPPVKKATPKSPTTNAEMIAAAKAAIAKLENSIKTTQQSAIELGALNPSVIKKAEGETNAEFLIRKQATEALARQNAMADNPLLNKAVKPTDAPAGKYYSWIGGTNTGQWQLYDIPGYGTTNARPDAIITTTQNLPGVLGSSKTYTDPATLSLIQSLQSQISQLTASNNSAAALAAAEKKTAAETTRRNAIEVLTERFQRYGLGSLVNKIRELAIDGATEATITLGLQETQEYKTRFKANQARIAKGLQVLSPGEYLNVEDGYRQVLRAYGLKQFDTDDYVSQFIANDVSAAELSNRVVTAVQRVQNADPAISRQLRDYYGIGQADLVAYVLDPNQQFQKIERQVAASEIGVAAARQGLQAGVSVAEQLAAQGVTQAEAQKGYATIADILPTAEKLSDIYGNTLDTYGQSEAEQEVFNSLASAQRKRQKLTQREIASFSGAAGTNKTSLTTSAVGQF